MSLPTEQHKFILQDDGKIYLMDGDSAVEVSNQEEVNNVLYEQFAKPTRTTGIVTGTVYSLLCSVEKKSTPCPDRDYKCADGCWGSNTGCRFPTVTALVTFSKPEQKELLTDLMKTDQEYGMYDQPEEKETQDSISGLRFKARPNGKAETQEELFNDILDVLEHFNHYYKGKEMAQIIFKRIMQYYTITRNEL